MGKLKNALIGLVDSLYHKFHTDEDIPPLNEQLNNIMNHFDFDRVATFMSWEQSRRIYDEEGLHIGSEQWMMINNNHEYSVPTEDELKTLARSLLNEVIKLYEPSNPDRQLVWIGTGPFKVACRYGILELMCVIEYWSYD